MRELMWKFETANFVVCAWIEPDFNYQYDGDDEDGEIQAALHSGEYVAFDTDIEVHCNGVLIGSDSLGGSVYAASDVQDFFQSHRSPEPLNRNCTIMRAALGDNVRICHYFPGMVRQAVSQAREALRDMPKVRVA